MGLHAFNFLDLELFFMEKFPQQMNDETVEFHFWSL